MAKMTVYDMVRSKAKAMGHNAANFSDKVLESYAQYDARKMNLLGAKLYLENYMMGNVDPADFAAVLADNDQLRYTVSDLCRMKLEPRELNVQRGSGYIDVAAGVKTFWSEIRVPLPSEREAARDLRNIALGVEAGKRQAGPSIKADMPASETPAGETSADETHDKPKRRSFRDVLDSVKQRAASMAVEKLTPIAEGRKEEKTVDEAWLETEDGQAYKEAYTRRAAQQVENVVMDIEAGKDKELAPEERRKAMQAAGMAEEAAENFVQGHDFERRSGYEEAELGNTTEVDVQDLFSQETKNAAELRSGYTREELGSSADSQMDELMQQISRHMGQEQPKSQKTAEKGQDRKRGRQREDRIYGQFEGKDVSFKNQWSSHTFTDEEAKKLLVGESISFEYEKDGKTKTASGKLEWQEYEGRPFLGFKADFSRKQEASSELFTAQDEAAMDYYSGNAASQEEDMDDYFARMAQDMEGYQAEETPDFYEMPDEGQPELSAQDLAGLFEDDANAVQI